MPTESFDESPLALEQRQREILNSSSYRKAYKDEDFLTGSDAREIRLLTEYVKPMVAFRRHDIRSTIILFGSARILAPDVAHQMLDKAFKRLSEHPNSQTCQDEVRKAEQKVRMSRYYELATKFASLITRETLNNQKTTVKDYEKLHRYVICTGGGGGIMEAGNRGAAEAGGLSIGLNISLPHEQKPNPYITPNLCFQFHYFAMRKLHFLLRAKALAVFPGGFGTFDELFEALTLRQTNRMQPIPIVLFGKAFWEKCINFDYLVETEMISASDLKLFTFVETPEEGMQAILDFYGRHQSGHLSKSN